MNTLLLPPQVWLQQFTPLPYCASDRLLTEARRCHMVRRVGFHKPHLPFYFPKEFGDLYPPAEDIAPPAFPTPPTGMPLAAWHEGSFNNRFNAPCPDSGPNSTRVFRRAYYSENLATCCHSGRDSYVRFLLRVRRRCVIH